MKYTVFDKILWKVAPGYEKEYKFHPSRRWRFDFSWVPEKVALEIEGGTWAKKSRHTSGAGYAGDCEKYSEAAILGWCVIRATTDMVKSGAALDMVERAIKTRTK